MLTSTPADIYQTFYTNTFREIDNLLIDADIKVQQLALQAFAAIAKHSRQFGTERTLISSFAMNVDICQLSSRHQTMDKLFSILNQDVPENRAFVVAAIHSFVVAAIHSLANWGKL